MLVFTGKNYLVFKGKVKDLIPILKEYPNISLKEAIQLTIN